MIKGEPVAAVQQYKYLGAILDEKLQSDANTDAICKKGKSTVVLFKEAEKI